MAEKLKVLKNVTEKMHPSWNIYLSSKTFNENKENHVNKSIPEDTEFYCGVCGGENLNLISSGIYGSIAGGADFWEFKCSDCSNFTQYEWEWG